MGNLVAFTGESKLQQSCYPTNSACWVFECFHYPSNCDMTGSLTCAQMFLHAIVHGVCVCVCVCVSKETHKRVCTESWLGEKSLAIGGIKPASITCQSDALPGLHPPPWATFPRMAIILIITIQEIYTAHNPHLKTRAQCAHRKTQNKHQYKKKMEKKEKQTENIITTTPWTITQSTREKKNAQNNSQRGG